MGCDHLDFESQFLAALTASTTFEIVDDTLKLTDGTPKNTLSFVRNVVHHLPLEGTSWSCFGFQEQDADTVTMTKTQVELSLLIQSNGRVSGSVNCNSFGGSAKTGDDGSIKIALSGVTEMACDSFSSEEADFLSWLNATDSYQIHDAQLLLINSKTKQTLVFEAPPIP